jgi:hypothetical protein
MGIPKPSSTFLEASLKARGDGTLHRSPRRHTLSVFKPAAAILNGESPRKVKTVRLIRNLPSGSVAFKNGEIGAPSYRWLRNRLPFVPAACGTFAHLANLPSILPLSGYAH